jgi:signal transduction histidine kinase
MVVADSLRSGMISIEGDYNFHRKHLFTVVNKCIKPYEMMAKEKGVIIKKPIIKPNDIYVEIASEEFELALKNLINNAVKYSYFGTTERSNYVEIIGNLSIKKGYYEIKISNLGIGIEPEEIKNRTITKKFVRGKLSNDSERIGTGIGLFVVEKVIKKHKGWLEFTSEFKDGPYLNTFSIGFPITHENGG